MTIGKLCRLRLRCNFPQPLQARTPPERLAAAFRAMNIRDG
jgi:hypothetical protein